MTGAETAPPSFSQRADTRRSTDLTAAERALITLAQRVWFGRIENVTVANGEPSCGTSARVVYSLKLGCSAGRTSHTPDYELKQEVKDLIGTIRRTHAGVIRKIEVRHGIPIHIELEVLDEAAAQAGGYRA